VPKIKLKMNEDVQTLTTTAAAAAKLGDKRALASPYLK
jgi:hypothetical protein